MGYRTYGAWVCAAIGLGALIPVALGSRTGAEIGFNGGVASIGATCNSCHEFNEGSGRVELLGVPQRYRAGAVYDLTLRITDPEQVGAGFEVSVENENGHQGTMLRTDEAFTDFSPGAQFDEYITHTHDGVGDSIDQWSAGGGSYEYHFAWQAPNADAGRLTIFGAGNAINDQRAFLGDRYYSTDATLGFALPGDADGDEDADLLDFATLMNCGGAVVAPGSPCDYIDADSDTTLTLSDVADWIAARTGPTAEYPAEFVLADAVRGGKLYDNWRRVIGAPTPPGNHPLYPAVGTQSGSTTFRCKECHGWDYLGVSGQYGSGSHYTGIRGVSAKTYTPREIFDLLKADPVTTPNGHNMDAYGMTDRDLWDVVRMTVDSLVDTSLYVSPAGEFIGDEFNGLQLFFAGCAACHGEDGTRINFGTELDPEYVGTLANANHWEFLHNVRFGHPGSSMPAFDLQRRPVSDAADVGVFCETLPTE